MNFEVIDNLFQVTALLTAAVCSLQSAWHTQRREYIFLAGAYGCFSMGTLYYLLHLILIGYAPQFYVAEIAWIASYLFLLTLEAMRKEKYKRGFFLPALAPALALGITSQTFWILGPSLLISFFFAVLLTVIFYTSMTVWTEHGIAPLDGHVALAVILQIGLYMTSAFMENFTEFNLYFLVDLILTVNLVLMYPALKREVKANE